MRRNRRVEVATAIVVACACLIGAVVAEFMLGKVSVGVELTNGTLTPVQEKSIDVALKLVDSFVTWSMAIIGGIALLLKLNIEEKLSVDAGEFPLAIVVVALAVASIFFGHLGIDLIQRTLAINQFPLASSAVHTILRLQYVAALSAIVFFGVFALTFLRKSMD